MGIIIIFHRSILVVSSLFLLINAAAPLEKTAVELGYGVRMYECDGKWNEVTTTASPKSQGSILRVCFEPNAMAQADGVGIRSIDSFTWKKNNNGNDNDGAEQAAVVDGRDDGVLSSLECNDADTICSLDTMLGADFYSRGSSVYGVGTATMTMGSGSVETGIEEGGFAKVVSTSTMSGTSMSSSSSSSSGGAVSGGAVSMHAGTSIGVGTKSSTSVTVKTESHDTN
jgi:hypothetical protein